MTMQAETAALEEGHFAQWRRLFLGYAAFYKTEAGEDVVRRAWEWIVGGRIAGIAAQSGDGSLLGFAHLEVILRPLRGAPMGYLHDLFVDPAARGAGIGRMLVEEAGRRARERGCSTMRWATAPDNVAARRLYDRLSEKTAWVIYERAL